jgi:Fungal rhodopsin domain
MPRLQTLCTEQLLTTQINALTDLIAVLLPIRTVWTLQLPTRQVVIVVLLFSLGFMSCIAGIIRTYFMYRVTKLYDQTWNSYPVWITSAVELYIGMVSSIYKNQRFLPNFCVTNQVQISASIPATKPFFTSYLPQVFGSMATVPSHISQSSRQRTQQRSTHTVVITGGGHHDQEMLTFEKALAAGKSGTSSIVSRTESRRESEEDDWIRVAQSIGIAKGEP